MVVLENRKNGFTKALLSVFFPWFSVQGMVLANPYFTVLLFFFFFLLKSTVSREGFLNEFNLLVGSVYTTPICFTYTSHCITISLG